MNSDSQEEKRLFAEALQFTSPEQRAEFLRKACGDDAQLRQHIEALLEAHVDAGEFLQEPLAGVSASTLAITTSVVPLTEKPGDKIGRYKLREQIGEGGCGVVYVAEQEEPVRRRVALKVIKLGMDTKQVVARFEAERQALALMDHPHIAKVLDAGATDMGRPYFVMELVRGIKITDYCDKNNLSTEERLKLFIQVCSAIQHAHQKGIIHRDIKPSNILVTLHDSVPVPKVIDFGIAKATSDQRLTDKTVYTAFEQFIGTPAYMSPEQAEMSGLDIDTRSDIYSLGVLLYELLTSRTPFDTAALLKAGLDQMRRIIREQEPQRPSTRLSTLEDADLTAVAIHRRSEPPKLLKLIRGDLDWIVMKSLEKDRTRRFETVNALAMDLQRHLTNEPVVARPPSQMYRLQKLVRRNKVPLTVTALVALLVILGASVLMWSLRKERDARQRAIAAEAAQDRLKQQADLISLRDSVAVFNQQGEHVKAEETLREVLKRQKQLGESADSEVASTLRLLGEALAEQRKYSESESVFRDALAVLRRQSGSERYEIAQVLNQIGNRLVDQKKFAEAVSTYEESLTIQRKLLGENSYPLVTQHQKIASLLLMQKKLPEAEAALRDALAAANAYTKRTGFQANFAAEIEDELAKVLNDQGKFIETEEIYQKKLPELRKEYGNFSPTTADYLSKISALLVKQGRFVDAENPARESLRIREMNFPESLSLETASGKVQLGRILAAQAKYAEAEDVLQSIPEYLKQSKNVPSQPDEFEQAIKDLIETYDSSGHSNGVARLRTFRNAAELRKRGDSDARTATWNEAAKSYSAALELDPDVHWLWFQLAPLLAINADASRYQQHRHDMLVRFRGTEDPTIAERTAKVCLMLPVAGADLATASRLADTAVTAGKEHPGVVYFQFAKGLAEYRQGRFASAVEWTQKVLAQPGVDFRDMQAYTVLAMAHHQLKHPDEARTALAKGIEIAETKLPKLESGDLGEGWHDWIIAHTLMREAKALIEDSSKKRNEEK